MSSNVIGRVERLAAGNIEGWAYQEGNLKACQIVVTTGDGTTVSMGRAARARRDLQSIGIGRTNFAFRIAIPEQHMTATLHVWAEGAEIGGSPYTHENPLKGNVWQDKTDIIGIIDPFNGDANAVIRVVNQDNECVAEGKLSDSKSKRSSTNSMEFRLPISPSFFDGQQYYVDVYCDDARFANTMIRVVTDGYLDVQTQFKISGWLTIIGHPSTTLELEVFNWEERVGSGRCNVPRPDVKIKHPYNFKCGFDILISQPKLANLQFDLFSIRIKGSKKSLFNGPHIGAKRWQTVVAIQRTLNDVVQRATNYSHLAITLARQQATIALQNARSGPDYILYAASNSDDITFPPRLNIIIPIYKNVALTKACIDSVIAHRNEVFDRVVLVNDCSPDPAMAIALSYYERCKNVVLISNPDNLGFVGSVNRALEFCKSGDAMLLNSDTFIYPGVIEEICGIGRKQDDVATVTPLSNNATIFSYPHPDLQVPELKDLSWHDAAEILLSGNAGKSIEVPTGHGFCMFIARRALDQVGLLDHAFGRGYGEENDFCARCSDLGLRHLAAVGAFVLHHESISFAEHKPSLLTQNLKLLEQRYPEYAERIIYFEEADPLRTSRRILDHYRLRKQSGSRTTYTLIITNWLEGGAHKSVKDFVAHGMYSSTEVIYLTLWKDQSYSLRTNHPLVLIKFSETEIRELFDTLNYINVVHTSIHQLLGANKTFVSELTHWIRNRPSEFVVHDFYSLCPRVCLIDSSSRYCEVPEAAVCLRCVMSGGSHEASRLRELTPADHRHLFSQLLSGLTQIIAPSHDTLTHFQKVFKLRNGITRPHPELPIEERAFSKDYYAGTDPFQIVLIGAIGPHKGSNFLISVLKAAQIREPRLHFNLVGYTNCDEAFEDLPNITIFGPYNEITLPKFVAEVNGKFCLFLHRWPETFSYTLSEAYAYGLIPIVPDLGAPAERVRSREAGEIYPYLADSLELVTFLIKLVIQYQMSHSLTSS